MSDVRQRIADQFPSVYITLASVMVGLILEDLVSIVREADALGSAGGTARFWVQVAYSGLASVAAWSSLSHTAMARRKVPGPRDTLSVYFVFVYLFLLNSVVGSAAHVWFYAAAGYLGLSVFSVYDFSRTLPREDPALQGFRDIWSVRGPLPFNLVSLAVAAFAGAASHAGVLGAGGETLGMIAVLVLLVAWLVRAYRIWFHAIPPAATAGEAGASA